MYVKTTKKGERVIVDPAVTTARVYNWFYLFINVGALIGQLSMAYAERYVGFYLSFLLPTVYVLPYSSNSTGFLFPLANTAALLSFSNPTNSSPKCPANSSTPALSAIRL